jgi:acyl-CoA synthetase (NDP forming)/GNAT superfamily N-acetyltransferase
MSAPAESGTYALLTDGTTIEIRPTRPDDFEAVRDMHAQMSPENLYMRFFGISRVAAEQEARRVCREPAPDRAALLAVLDGRVIGCISYQVTDGQSAEVGMAVADDMHSRGIGTLLLEHLISLARRRGVRAFAAETLAENAPMLDVFAHAGLRPHRTLADGVYEFSFPLPGGEVDAGSGAYREAVAERERSADVASLRHVLAPASVAVIGVSRRPGSVGRVILENIIDAGFSGRVYAVNPKAGQRQAGELPTGALPTGALPTGALPTGALPTGALPTGEVLSGGAGGVPWVPSAAAVPEPVDLAVIAVPAAAVAGIAEDCGQRGVKALVVTASGVDAAARAELLGICRRYGMRLVGPTSFGVANTACALDATFAARHPRAGRAGLALQSGGVGIVLLEHLSRLGVGISSFVSLGDKDDVSGNDMLLWWESDAATKLAVLYLDSLGNPRKFARTARAVGRNMPVLTVDVGRSAAGRRLAAMRAAAAATPQLTRRALFEQAGVIATANLGELLDATALLAAQPIPAGRRVGVVANTRGGGVLAADACGDVGLRVATLTEDTRRALRELLPAVAAVTGPVDTTSAARLGQFRRCLELVGADPGVDAVLAVTATTATSDLVAEVCAARLPVPVAAAIMDQTEAVRLLPGPDEDSPAVPAYAYPESAARALGHAARYGAWRATPPGSVPELDGLRPERARELVDSFLARAPGGGWLPRPQAVELLGCYGVALLDSITATTEDDAATAADRFGTPVALRADVPGRVHGSRARAVRLDLHGADEVRRGFGLLRESFGSRMAGVIVQPMIPGGVEVSISVLEEKVFGPLVLFGIDGSASVLPDRAARLAPLTESDADALIRSVRAAPLLLSRPAGLISLRDALLRVSQLPDHVPQVAELELSPVIVRQDGALAVDAQIRIQPAEPADAYLRRLR